MTSFWQGFEKRAEEPGQAAAFSPTTTSVEGGKTRFMTAWGVPSKERIKERGLDYEDNYSTSGAFGY